jgi:hypothetical protein
MITLSQKPRKHLGPAVDGVDSCGLAFQVPKPARPDKKFFGGPEKVSGLFLPGHSRKKYRDSFSGKKSPDTFS